MFFPLVNILPTKLTYFRVEKYRPNSLDDVEGHQDILATINKFVEANVCMDILTTEAVTDWILLEITASTAVRTSRHWQDVDSSSTRPTNIWQQEYAPNGVRTECFG